MRVAGALTAIVLLVAACSGGDGDGGAQDDVLPFELVQASEMAFEADPADPGRGIFRVTTTEPMICAIVWGETEELGRFNNSLAMNGTGIIDHDVFLPGAQAGVTYSFVVQGTTAGGQLYSSEPGEFTIPAAGRDSTPQAADDSPPMGANLAVGASIVDVSSEFSESWAAANAIDGDLGTEWSSADSGDDGYLTIDLGGPHDIAGVEFVTRSMADGSAVTDTFTATVDGTTLGPFAAASPATPRVHAMEATGRTVRFDVESSTGGNTGAVEVRVFAPA